MPAVLGKRKVLSRSCESERPCKQKSSRLVVGSDCSGLGGANLALELLGIPFMEAFASDISATARKIIHCNYRPEVIYEDVSKRNIEDVAKVQLYTAGFPCISWSKAGKGEGLNSKHGLAGLHCLRYIECRRPTSFLLENVPSLASSAHLPELEMMLNFLKSLKDSSDRVS